jgi:hypothetical protein
MEFNPVIDEILAARAYKAGYEPPPAQKMFTIEDRTVGTMHNFLSFTGLPKSGKSVFLSAAIASAFTPYSIYSIATFLPAKRKGLLLMDTESSEDDFYRQMARIKKNIGREPPKKDFHAFMMRDRNSNEIKEYIEYYLQIHPEISIVYVDGMLDILTNYNDERESKSTIDWLKRITANYGILCIGVVHTGKKDNHTLGHFGSMMDRYCQSVLIVEKDEKQVPNLHSLKPKMMRSDGHFNTVQLSNNNGVFEQVM